MLSLCEGRYSETKSSELRTRAVRAFVPLLLHPRCRDLPSQENTALSSSAALGLPEITGSLARCFDASTASGDAAVGKEG